MPKSNLLAYLTINCHVDYISDLSLTPICKGIIREIDDNQYSLKEWNDAVDYLCKQKISFSSSKSAKEYLINFKP